VFNNIHNPHLEVAEVAQTKNLEVTIFPCKGKYDVKAIYRLKRFIKQRGITIIHSHGYKSNFYGFAAADTQKVRRVTTCHNWLGADSKMRFYAWLDKKIVARFDKIIAVSQTIHQELLRQRIPANKITIIPNGISLNRYHNSKIADQLREEFSITKDCKVIGTVGRLSAEKGQTHLLRAVEKVLSRYPKIVVLIVGDGPLRQQLEAEASTIPAIFTGMRDDMPDLYSLMDIFVLPSLTEGLPMALLEAMAARKPIVATSVGEVPHVLKEGKAGILVPPGNPDALADALLSLLTNEVKALDFVRNSSHEVEEHYGSEKMAERYIAVYEELLH
jgi:glycosyltransferase involved in cell wall biosynthesis